MDSGHPVEIGPDPEQNLREFDVNWLELNVISVNGAFLTSWTGRNEIPYPTGTILSRMANVPIFGSSE